jgi:hypothetical protein
MRPDVPPSHRQRLVDRLRGERDPNGRARITAEAVLARFDARRLTMTVVGGSAVALWDPAAHVSRDIDLVGVASRDELDEVLNGEFGFTREGRHWFDENLAIAIEAPAWVLEPPGAVAVMIGSVRVISLEDLVLDRVEQWHGTGALEVALQTGRLLAHGLLDHERLVRRAEAIDATAPLEALRLLTAHGDINSALSHSVHQTLAAEGLAAVRARLGIR